MKIQGLDSLCKKQASTTQISGNENIAVRKC